MEQPQKPTVQKKILVVDDSPEVLKFVSSVLTNKNYHVVTAVSGPDALRQVADSNGEIDLLLSDFEMPEMNGMELAAALTADRPSLPVLLMSGFEEGMLVLNEGWHFMPKPFIASKLLAMVVTLISPERPSRFADYPLPASYKAGA